MKKFFTLITFALLTFSGFAQNSVTKSYDDLIKQSRRARTTSIVLVSVGPVIALGGIGTLLYGVIENEAQKPGGYYDVNGNYILNGPQKYTTEIIVGAAGTLVGIGLALTSIHFSNKASDLKREARKMKLKTSTDRISIPGLQNGYASNRARQFKVSLIIPLGR